jgi:hypothetical protein
MNSDQLKVQNASLVKALREIALLGSGWSKEAAADAIKAYEQNKAAQEGR